MSTFPILYLYNPSNKTNKDAICIDLCSDLRERIPQAINSFFLKKSLPEFMWIATAKRGDMYNWNLHSTLGPSFKRLEVIKIK